MHSLFKRPVFLAALVIAIAALAAVVTLALTRHNSVSHISTQTESLQFRLKWFIYSSFAHHFVALHDGYFRQEGLNVTIEPGGAGLDPIKLVAAGADDVGLASYAQILLAREKGIPVVAIAEEYVRSGVIIMTLKDSGIATPYDFVGKRVGIVPGSDPTTVYQALMAKLGIDRSSITEVPIGFDLTPLFEKRIDVSAAAYITNQPIVASDKGIPVDIIDPADYGVVVGGNVIFTSEDTLAKRRDVLKRFLKADLRGIIDSQSMPDQDVVKIVLSHNDKLNKDTELKIWAATKAILLSNDARSVGLMPASTWQRTADLLRQEGLLKEVPDLKKAYTNVLVADILRDNTRSSADNLCATPWLSSEQAKEAQAVGICASH